MGRVPRSTFLEWLRSGRHAVTIPVDGMLCEEVNRHLVDVAYLRPSVDCDALDSYNAVDIYGGSVHSRSGTCFRQTLATRLPNVLSLAGLSTPVIDVR